MSGENSTGLGRVTKPRVGGFKTIKTIPPLIAAFSLSLSLERLKQLPLLISAIFFESVRFLLEESVSNVGGSARLTGNDCRVESNQRCTQGYIEWSGKSQFSNHERVA